MLNEIVSTLPTVSTLHSRTSSLYRILEKVIRPEAEKAFKEDRKSLGVIGDFYFPYFKMGAIDSIDLFGLDELILFSFYWINRNRYKKAVDIGANIGLHSTILAKCGYQVEAYEPDPTHFAKLQEVLSKNQISSVNVHQAAVSDHAGEVEFVRVLGNTTSSHIAGCKTPYGDLERFTVPVANIREIMRGADLIKMDVEGHEDTIIRATTSNDWDTTDAVIEVGTEKKAKDIFAHLQTIGVHAFAQKSGWAKVTKAEEMPLSYKEGSLFISKKSKMPWE